VPSTRRVGSLDIDTDEEFQRREWRAERVGWLVMLGLVVAGILGLFGEGWLAQTSTAVVGNRLRVDYERIARHGSPATLRVALAPGAVPSGVALVWVDREYLEGVDLQDIEPRPDASWTARDRVVFAVRLNNPADSAYVTFGITPDNFWSRDVRVGLDGGPSVSFRQFVLP
jgi:hypothetical protein